MNIINHCHHDKTKFLVDSLVSIISILMIFAIFLIVEISADIYIHKIRYIVIEKI